MRVSSRSMCNSIIIPSARLVGSQHRVGGGFRQLRHGAGGNTLDGYFCSGTEPAALETAVCAGRASLYISIEGKKLWRSLMLAPNRMAHKRHRKRVRYYWRHVLV